MILEFSKKLEFSYYVKREAFNNLHFYSNWLPVVETADEWWKFIDQ